jgi:hypothetical protein
MGAYSKYKKKIYDKQQYLLLVSQFSPKPSIKKIIF